MVGHTCPPLKKGAPLGYIPEKTGSNLSTPEKIEGKPPAPMFAGLHLDAFRNPLVSPWGIFSSVKNQRFFDVSVPNPTGSKGRMVLYIYLHEKQPNVGIICQSRGSYGNDWKTLVLLGGSEI